MRISKACLALVLPLSLVWACGSSSSSFDDGAVSGRGGAGSDATAGSGLAFGGDGLNLDFAGEGPGPGAGGAGTSSATGGSVNSTGSVTATGTTACSNGLDDDDDGLIDGFDPECTGPTDDDEGTFATGIPGDNRDPKWQDCFFDGNSGAGDDKCRYATGCLTGELEATDEDCALSNACLKFCAPLTPNGCDCFGCCTVQTADGDSLDIETSASCSLDKLADEDACPRCVKSDACGNNCGRCELCPGKTVADLPTDCGPTGSGGSGGSSGTGGTSTGGGPAYTCDNGEQVCGSGLPECDFGDYCSLGCCIRRPPR